MQHSDDIFFLLATYAIAYGIGVLISKLFWGLRAVFLIVALYWYFGLIDVREFKLSVFLVFIMPVCLFLYPSLNKMLASKLRTLNPFLWLYHKIKKWRRLKHYKQEEAEREAQAEKEARARAEEIKRKAEQKKRYTSKTDTTKDPYDVLGVSKQDSLETIEKAYKALAKKYHPTAVHHLGEEFQEMAHEKFIAIKQAWDEIKEKTS